MMIHKIIIKIVSIVVAGVFFYNTCCYGLAPLPASQNPRVRVKIESGLFRFFLVPAKTSGEQEFLKNKNVPGLMLDSGKYFVPKDLLEKDDNEIRRAIAEIEIRALMQVIEEEARIGRIIDGIEENQYSKISEVVLEAFPLDELSDVSEDVYLRDILSRAFGWITLIEDKLLSMEDIKETDMEDYVFVRKIRPLIFANKQECFTEEFWDHWTRKGRIQEAKQKKLLIFQAPIIEGERREDLSFLSLGLIGKISADITRDYLRSERKHQAGLDKGKRTFEKCFTNAFFEKLKKIFKTNRKKGIPTLFGITGSPAGGKTSIVKRIADSLRIHFDCAIKTIYFDDWLLQASDREISSDPNKKGEDVRKKFEVRKFIRSMKLFARGHDLIKPIYDTDAHGRIKIGINEAGEIEIFNGKDFKARVVKVSETVEDGNGEMIEKVFFRLEASNVSKNEILETGTKIKLGETDVRLNKHTEEGTIIQINGNRYRIGAYVDKKRTIEVIDEEGQAVNSLIDPDTDEILASSKSVLTNDGGHINERGEVSGKPWDAKELIKSEGDMICMVEGILSLYDYPDISKEDQLHNYYSAKIFVDANYDGRLVRGIIRTIQRFLLSKNKKMVEKLDEEERKELDSDLEKYEHAFWKRQRSEEYLISLAKDYPGIIEVSNQTIEESIFENFKYERLLDPKSLSILKKIGIKVHSLNRNLKNMAQEYIKEYLLRLPESLNSSFGKLALAHITEQGGQLPLQGESFDVFFVGGGLALKVYNQTDTENEENIAFYNDTLKVRGGGIIVPSIMLDLAGTGIKERIGGEMRPLGQVLVQNRGESFGERLYKLVEDGEIREAEKLIDDFFKLQQSLWKVGIIDTEPNLIIIDRTEGGERRIRGEYGIILDNGQEKVMAFISGRLTSNPEMYDPAVYNKEVENIPEGLKKYFLSKMKDMIPDREEFKKEFFRKEMDKAKHLSDISHGAINKRQIDHIQEKMVECRTMRLKHVFDQAENKRIAPGIIWVRAYLRAIVESARPVSKYLHNAVQDLYGMFLADPLLCERQTSDVLKKTLRDRYRGLFKQNATQLNSAIDMLYRIHREYEAIFELEKEYDKDFGILRDYGFLWELVTGMIPEEKSLSYSPVPFSLGEVKWALKQGRTYNVRYDTSRLSESQQKVVEAYIDVLRDRFGEETKIGLIKTKRSKKDPIISIKCEEDVDFSGGWGHVYVEVPYDGDIENYLLRVTGMMNIAFAASNIPSALGEEERLYAEYSDIIAYIKRQYRSIMGEGLDLDEGQGLSTVLKQLRNIKLLLPKFYKMPVEKIREYNDLARKHLTFA
ncbi:MAG: hypothetical protein KAI70_03010 [Candidatus Omnitrophica bacterium]|nr:hypothetical protein [Candidatus Omnitrophota bacterium]